MHFFEIVNSQSAANPTAFFKHLSDKTNRRSIIIHCLQMRQFVHFFDFLCQVIEKGALI